MTEMKKTLIYLFSAVLLFASCTLEKFEKDVETVTDGKVTVSFSVALPVSGPMTKALGETAAIRNLYVAVFDEGGYLVEYVPATFVTATTVEGETTYTEVTPTDGVYSPNSSGIYTFEVTLTTTDQPRSLHFIANSPVTSMEWGSEIQRISTLVSSNDNDAYWQNIQVEGILANASEMASRIGLVSLVRNFVKVSISSVATSSFMLVGAKIYNVPDKGTVAIYTPDTGFVPEYETHDFAWASNASNYGGYMPASASLINDFREDEMVEAVLATPSDETSGVVTDYIYERPAPTSNPCFAIIEGYYRNGSTYAWSSDLVYYKINLRDNAGNYYPFLRNYHYKVKVKTVGMKGYPSLEEALESAGDGGDVSTNIEYADLSEITAFNSRLIVSETSVDVIGSQTIELWYKFQPNVSSSTISNGSVTVTESEAGIYGAAISSYTVASSDSADGSRKITVQTTAADATYIKSQTLTLVGTNSNGDSIQRVITINVRPVMTMKVSCTKKVPAVSGSPLQLKIGIPAGLPQSLFPLQFKIEAEKSSIMPAAGESMPVENGLSNKPNSTKPAFFYIKTLSYSEYSELATDDEGYKYFDSHFKTNTAASASNIYVANKFFETGTCNFANAMTNFFTVSFDPMYVGTNSSSSVMHVTTMDNTPFSIELNGATATQTSFTPTDPNGSTVNIPITTSSYGNGVSFTVTAAEGEEYEVYLENEGTEYRTLSIPAEVLTAAFSVDPCSSYNNNKGVANVSIGHNGTTALGTVKFDVTRNNLSIVAPRGSVDGSRSGSALSRRYSYTITLSNYDPEYTYYYSTSTNGTKTKLTGTTNMSSNVITLRNLSSASTIYIWGQVGTEYSNSSSASYNSTSLSAGRDITRYGYSGTNQAAIIKLTQNVTSSSEMYFFINGESDTETIGNIIQGVSGDELHIVL